MRTYFTGARQDSSRGDFTLRIRAFRISLPSYNAACLSLTPHLSGVWAVVSGSEPLQRFTRHRKPLNLKTALGINRKEHKDRKEWNL